MPFVLNLCEKGDALSLFPKLTAPHLVGFIHTCSDLPLSRHIYSLFSTGSLPPTYKHAPASSIFKETNGS